MLEAAIDLGANLAMKHGDVKNNVKATFKNEISEWFRSRDQHLEADAKLIESHCMKTFWTDLSISDQYPNLSRVALSLSKMICSEASCERIFSLQKMVHTQLRACLSPDQVEAEVKIRARVKQSAEHVRNVDEAANEKQRALDNAALALLETDLSARSEKLGLNTKFPSCLLTNDSLNQREAEHVVKAFRLHDQAMQVFNNPGKYKVMFVRSQEAGGGQTQWERDPKYVKYGERGLQGIMVCNRFWALTDTRVAQWLFEKK